MNEPDAIEILLVEDSKADAEMTLRNLVKAGIVNHVQWVKDGAEALDYIHRRGAYVTRPDIAPRLVLLDIRLPKVDGITVLRELKGDPATRMIPVVMLTSSREEPDLQACYAIGVNSYVVKPVDFNQFAAVVRQLGMYWQLINEPPVLPGASVRAP